MKENKPLLIINMPIPAKDSDMDGFKMLKDCGIVTVVFNDTSKDLSITLVDNGTVTKIL